MYLGVLPWQGIKVDTKQEKYSKILEKKQSTTIDTLCKDCPVQFAWYLVYTRNLKFEDRPDYIALRKLFRDCRTNPKFCPQLEQGAATKFDWEEIEGFDDKLVAELRERAQDQLLIEAISTEEDLDVHGPSDDLLELRLITPELAFSLARAGVNTKNKLAEQSVDDLQEIEELDEDLAAKVILQAREDWFKAGEVIPDDDSSEEELGSEE